MPDSRVGIVEVVRDFLMVHQRLSDLISSYQTQTLSFDLVKKLVGDDNASALYRLKEKCHAIFRSEIADPVAEVRTAALFDLAIGSLFHETMILRENLYQQERYGPRVEALKSQASQPAPELSREFEKILASSALRLGEAVEEVGALLALTSDQLFRLLIEESDNELLARCLYEEQQAVAAVFPRGFRVILAEIHGSTTAGLMKAASSYAESAYYDQALEVLNQAPDGEGLASARAFASAMQAFLVRDYPCCVENLSVWLGADLPTQSPSRIKLALAAVNYIEKVEQGSFPPEVRDRLCELSDDPEANAKI
jgi:hypothetical protein